MKKILLVILLGFFSQDLKTAIFKNLQSIREVIDEEYVTNGYHITFTSINDYNKFQEIANQFLPGHINDSWEDELKIEFYINSNHWIYDNQLDNIEMQFYTFLYANGFGHDKCFILADERVVPALVEWGSYY